MNRIRLRRDDHSGALIGAGGRGVLIGQGACWLMTLARKSIDSPRAKSDRLHVWRDKWQLAAKLYFNRIKVQSEVVLTIIFFTFLFQLHKARRSVPTSWTCSTVEKALFQR